MTRGWEDPRRALVRHGLAPKRAWSQCFLVSRHAHEAIVAAAQLAAGDAVIELGAGLGTLTGLLADTGARVTAVERDPDLVHVIQTDWSDAGVRCLAADAATLDYGELRREAGAPLIVVGNIPYSITGGILKRLMQSREHLRRVVLTVQREVRDRLVAAADSAEYGALGVFAGAGFQVETVRHLARKAFHPVPRVDSSIVRLTPRIPPLAVETDAFREVVRAAFGARRKTLRNALARAGGTGRADAALGAAGIDPTRRGETLSITEFDALAQAWATAPRAGDDSGAL